MKLSVIIVNYNVQYFLEQCLISVEKAIKTIETEVFVVDNNSVDSSVEMVKDKFPWVKLIAKNENLGFSKANNLAMEQSVGEYILLLNPDTLVEEDTFLKCIEFMDAHPKAGGLGIKMMDGKGRFLPESKRSLPTPSVAFYKIFGLSNLFPKSKRFGRYHLGHLSAEENHEIEILSGAYMWMRKQALDEVGLLDESFFMYGEDIDLSYRILKGGWGNFYLSTARIIHYKGESTKKSSVNYVFVFYNAMIIFAKKHFSHKNAFIFSFLIKLAIYFRAGIALVRRFISKIFYPTLDAGIAFGSYWLTKVVWEKYIKKSTAFYPEEFIKYEIPIFVVFFISILFLSKGYKNIFNVAQLGKALFVGVIAVFIAYALLGEDFRFSRGIIFIGTLAASLFILTSRYLIHFVKTGSPWINPAFRKRIIIIGAQEEVSRVSSIMHQSNFQPKFFAKVSPTTQKTAQDLGTIDQIDEIVMIHKINEIIFCSKNLSAQQILSVMEKNKKEEIEFKIAPEESLFIIGSNSIDSPGELYLIKINSLSKRSKQLNKRVFDLLAAFIFLLVLPFVLLKLKNRLAFVKDLFKVVIGDKTWVGYSNAFKKEASMPKLKQGVFAPEDAFDSRIVSDEVIHTVNIKYVNDYKMSDDWNILWKGIRKLDK